MVGHRAMETSRDRLIAYTVIEYTSNILQVGHLRSVTGTHLGRR